MIDASVAARALRVVAPLLVAIAAIAVLTMARTHDAHGAARGLAPLALDALVDLADDSCFLVSSTTWYGTEVAPGEAGGPTEVLSGDTMFVGALEDLERDLHSTTLIGGGGRAWLILPGASEGLSDRPYAIEVRQVEVDGQVGWALGDSILPCETRFP